MSTLIVLVVLYIYPCCLIRACYTRNDRSGVLFFGSLILLSIVAFIYTHIQYSLGGVCTIIYLKPFLLLMVINALCFLGGVLRSL